MVEGWKHKQAVKRGMDLVLAAGGLVLLAPVLCFIAVLIRTISGSPVLFRQKRPGLKGEIFMLYKFRTMRNESFSEGLPHDDEKRLTRLGRLLRKTSLDELPELWNVVRGEMSLVGPRPLLVDYLPLYSPEQSRRHDMKPGITGLAQISGRNKLNWEDRFRLDVWYVDHWSVGLDFRILLQTLFRVLRMDGISAVGHATMEPYQGKRRELA